MIRVGLTGNAASGKSTVSRIWKDAGVPVVSADELAREVVEPGSPALAEVRETFGEEVMTPDGRLDRSRMRDIVFRDAEARRQLEAILHPRIAELRERWTEARRRDGVPLVAYEIPLLFEVRSAQDFDVIVVVDAPAKERLRRLVKERGLAPAEARRILNSQGDPAVKRAAADYVLENSGSHEALEAEALRLLRRLQSGVVRTIRGDDASVAGGGR